MRYPIVIHKEENACYGVIVPDLPGCFSAGDTLDEAICNAKEAIECHLEGLLLDGDPVPKPKSIEVHKENQDYADGTWAIVEVDLAKLSDRTKRINIPLPEQVLRLIDEAAKRAGETRSGFLARAALEAIRRHEACIAKLVFLLASSLVYGLVPKGL